jgi:O-antigen/teichoic acid export membrane protein
VLLANTVYFLFLTNVLPTLDVGILTALNILIGLLVTICILAQPITIQSPIPAPLAVLKFLPEILAKNAGGAKRVFRESLILTGILSGVLAVVLIGAPSVIISLLGGESVLSDFIRLSAVDVVVWSLAQVSLGTLIAVGDMRKASLFIVLWSAIRYSLASVLLLRYAIVGVLVGFIIGDMVLFGMAFQASMWILRPGSGKSDISFSDISRYSIYTLGSALMGFGVSQADKIFTLAAQGLPELAIYNVAIVASSFTGLAPYALLTVLLPALSALYAANRNVEMRNLIRAYTRYVSLAVMPIAFGFASLTEVALRIFGPQYVGGLVPSVIVSAATGLTAIGSVYASALLALGELKWYSVANMFGLAALFVISAIFTPLIGLSGPALGRASLLFVAALLYGFAIQRRGYFELDSKALFASVGASFLMSAVVFVTIFWFHSFYVKLALVPVLIVVGALIYVGSLRLLHLVTVNDLEFATEILPRRFRWLLPKLAKFAGIDYHKAMT